MTFPLALTFVLKSEGGYSNDPQDPGGETRWGISKRAYPHLNIKALTREDASKIYLSDYWNAVGCHECLEPKLAFSMFDAAVNVGVGRVQKWLKEGAFTTHEGFNARRRHYYTAEVKPSLRARFLKGWLNRLNALEQEIQTLELS